MAERLAPQRATRFLFAALNLTALIAALLYFGRGGTAAVPAARVASTRAADAWHRGYRASGHDKGIYYRWVRKSCLQRIDHCWQIKLITHDRCSMLIVEGYAVYRGTTVGDLVGSRADVPPKTPVLIELIGASGSTRATASAPAITCY